MTHEPEFQNPAIGGRDLDRKARDLAECYARVLLGRDDGKRVLADLRAKFGVDRLVFLQNARGEIDINGGLLREGQRQVMTEIENAIRIGAPGQALSEPNL